MQPCVRFASFDGRERKSSRCRPPSDSQTAYGARGYHAVYREHEVNHCPGCGRTHWLIGRMSAECAFCATALPLAEASMRSHSGAGDHPAQEPPTTPAPLGRLASGGFLPHRHRRVAQVDAAGRADEELVLADWRAPCT